MFTDFIGCETIDVGLLFPDQGHGERIELVEIVRGVEHLVVPINSQPSDVFLNGLDIFRVFSRWIGVVESQVAHSAGGVLCNPEIEGDGLGMPDMEVPIGFRGKSCDDPSTVFTGGTIGRHKIPNEIR